MSFRHKCLKFFQIDQKLLSDRSNQALPQWKIYILLNRLEFLVLVFFHFQTWWLEKLLDEKVSKRVYDENCCLW